MGVAAKATARDKEFPQQAQINNSERSVPKKTTARKSLEPVGNPRKSPGPVIVPDELSDGDLAWVTLMLERVEISRPVMRCASVPPNPGLKSARSSNSGAKAVRSEKDRERAQRALRRLGTQSSGPR